MKAFYLISVRLYVLIIYVAAVFNSKAAEMIKGRKGWRNDLKNQIEENAKYIWFHCASLGEFEQARPLIEKVKNERSDYKVILSFFSPSGYNVRKNYSFADIVCYLPFDNKKNARDFVSIVNPKLAVFIKYEFWYYYINRLSSRQVPVYLISAVFRESQIFFKKYAGFYRNILSMYEKIFLQDENSAGILKQYEINNYLITGDTRTDRVIEVAREEYENTQLKTFSENCFTIVAGSTWPSDEKILAEYINNTTDKIKMIIAPHEVNSKGLSNLEGMLKVGYCRLSGSDRYRLEEIKVIIIDSIGILSKIYRFGQLAYVGGGFGKGIHNILEAAVYGIPVIFGPNHTRFNEANDLIKLGLAFNITGYQDFNQQIDKIFNNSSLQTNIKTNLKEYFEISKGSSDRIFQHIAKKMH